MEQSEGHPLSNRGAIQSQNRHPLITPGAGGIDTVSFVFRWGVTEEGHKSAEEAQAWAKIRSRFREASYELDTERGVANLWGNNRTGSYTSDLLLPGGIRFGITPRSYSIWVEGRLGALLSGDKKNGDLPPADFLRVAALRAAADLSVLFGFDASGEKLFASARVALRRIDIAGEISCSSPSLGLSLLRGFANLSFAGHRVTDAYGSNGRIETVNLRERSKKKGGGKIRFRIYDKGVESGSHRPGERLRFERELHFQSKNQMPVELVTSADVRGWWRKGWEPWIGKDLDKHGLKVCSLDEAAEAVLAMADSGELKWETAQRLAGALLVRRVRGEQWWEEQGSREAGYRWKKQMKELGVIPARSVSAPIDLGEALKSAADALVVAPLRFCEVPRRAVEGWETVTFEEMLKKTEEEMLERFEEILDADLGDKHPLTRWARAELAERSDQGEQHRRAA